MSVYFLLLLGSFAVPFLLSFDKKVHFYTHWKFLFPSVLAVGIVYVFFDFLFTKHGIWGFNPAYLSGIYFLNLPLEEIIFFLIIPYSSIFIHYVFLAYFPTTKLGVKTHKTIVFALITVCILLAVFNAEKAYTFYMAIKLLLALLLVLVSKSEFTRSFFISFLIVLLPFLLVNGILTGLFIPDEVVWYNDTENLGIRIFTIPVEDFGYALGLLLYNLLLINWLVTTFKKKH